jgi:hypothetical protein
MGSTGYPAERVDTVVTVFRSFPLAVRPVALPRGEPGRAPRRVPTEVPVTITDSLFPGKAEPTGDDEVSD